MPTMPCLSQKPENGCCYGHVSRLWTLKTPVFMGQKRWRHDVTMSSENWQGNLWIPWEFFSSFANQIMCNKQSALEFPLQVAKVDFHLWPLDQRSIQFRIISNLHVKFKWSDEIVVHIMPTKRSTTYGHTHSPNHTRTAALLYPFQFYYQRIMSCAFCCKILSLHLQSSWSCFTQKKTINYML